MEILGIPRRVLDLAKQTKKYLRYSKGTLSNTLLNQRIAEEAPDMLLLSESYRQQKDRKWIMNADGKAAVLVIRQGAGKDYAWATVANITFVSVHLHPNLTVGDFDTRLAEI